MKLIEDVPRPTEFTPPPFENYVRNEFEAPNFTPDLWLIASDEDRYIGMTVLYLQDDNPTFLVTGLTGVLREYRRRGLATALKRRNISQASELGGRFIQTSNEENNPMYQLNLKLGFQSMPADVDWEKKIGIS
jgi:GNAT superfamily N-acetyltransferase